MHLARLRAEALVRFVPTFVTHGVARYGRFALAPVGINGLVLGFGGVPPAAIRQGVDTLALVLERLRATRSGLKKS